MIGAVAFGAASVFAAYSNSAEMLVAARAFLGLAPEQYKSMRSSCYLYVEDADASMKRALENGATLEMEVGDQSYGDRQGGVRDTRRKKAGANRNHSFVPL